MKQVTIFRLSRTFRSVRRGKVHALKNVTLDIEPGSFFVLLGPSGCGKSTLLNILAGIERPTGGEVTIGDRVVSSVENKTHLSPRDRDIAMVFQSYALYPHLTVRENIAFPLTVAKLDKSETDRRVHEAAAILRIEPLLEARPAELSGGQRQRVALGRAIVRRPNLLLLDEPLSNLDALLRISMRAELKQIQRRLGVTTLYVTHDQTEAMSLGDRIAVLRDGAVLQTGTPDDIYDNPATAFVARFVGSPPMNLLPGDILADLPQHIRDRAPANRDEVTVGLRPEHLRFCERDLALLTGAVTMIGSLGGEKIVYVDLTGREILVRAGTEFSADENQTVGLTFRPQHLYFFDAGSGKRLS